MQSGDSITITGNTNGCENLKGLQGVGGTIRDIEIDPDGSQWAILDLGDRDPYREFNRGPLSRITGELHVIVPVQDLTLTSELKSAEGDNIGPAESREEELAVA